MKKLFALIATIIVVCACSKQGAENTIIYNNPTIVIKSPFGFPPMNKSVNANMPTQYGVELGKKLFNEKMLSANNTIACASCHKQENAFADNNIQAIGIYGRSGLRNVPPIQNMAFLKYYNWDGNILQLEKQPIVPIITHEEMNSSILEVIGKLNKITAYKNLFTKTFGDESITADRIYKSIAQYLYTLISAESKYDQVKRKEGVVFSADEESGYRIFLEKCESCHSGELFTDQSFRNIGFPKNPSADEAGRARVTGIPADYMSFRVPSLRNVEYTAPYGSFGQFVDIRAVLDYFDNGVLDADNLDPVFKNNNNRIPLTEQEKDHLISFLKTLSDPQYTQN